MIAALALTAALLVSSPPVVDVGKKVHAGESQYKGKWYQKQHESKRQCIRQRESRHHYHAVSASSTYRGAYQFSPALAIGAGWMIQKDLRKQGHPDAKTIGDQLRSTRMNQWAIYWQDYAFWIVWNKGKGRQHWAPTAAGTKGCIYD